MREAKTAFGDYLKSLSLNWVCSVARMSPAVGGRVQLREILSCLWWTHCMLMGVCRWSGRSHMAFLGAAPIQLHPYILHCRRAWPTRRLCNMELCFSGAGYDIMLDVYVRTSNVRYSTVPLSTDMPSECNGTNYTRGYPRSCVLGCFIWCLPRN